MHALKKHWGLVILDWYFEGRIETCGAQEMHVWRHAGIDTAARHNTNMIWHDQFWGLTWMWPTFKEHWLWLPFIHFEVWLKGNNKLKKLHQDTTWSVILVDEVEAKIEFLSILVLPLSLFRWQLFYLPVFLTLYFCPCICLTPDLFLTLFFSLFICLPPPLYQPSISLEI